MSSRPYRFQHTAARRRLGKIRRFPNPERWVSTHSRPKAAGFPYLSNNHHNYVSTHSRPKAAGTPCRRKRGRCYVSTHSRPKAAGRQPHIPPAFGIVSTHSRPKAAGSLDEPADEAVKVSTHSRPKAAGLDRNRQRRLRGRFQHTAARRRLGMPAVASYRRGWFQHTAARRRLVVFPCSRHIVSMVSTHSRPKAAGPKEAFGMYKSAVSTHSRPKAAGA